MNDSTKYDILPKQQEQHDLTRVPNPFTHNFQPIQKTFGVQSILVTDLVIFLANCQLKNLFGDITFDINTFCQKMGYNKANLQRKLSEEDRKQIYALGEELPVYTNQTGTHMIESYFETALWHATQKRLMMQKSYPVDDKTKIAKTAFIGVNLLEGFEINSDFSTKKSIRKTYTVKLGSGIKDYLITEYSLIELNDYNKLPNVLSYKVFYLYLCRIRILIQYKEDTNQEPIYNVSVDDLAKVFNYVISEPKDRKKFVKNTLDKINSYLTIGKFAYEFTGKGKYKYNVRFTFSAEVLKYFDEKTKAVFFKELYDRLGIEYIGMIEPNLSYRERMMRFKEIISLQDSDNRLSEREKFWAWFSSEENRTLKQSIYNKVYYDIFQISPDDPYSQNIFLK